MPGVGGFGGRWLIRRRSSCDQLRMNGYRPGRPYAIIPLSLMPSFRPSLLLDGLPHRHSGAGRNPEPRRRPGGVSVGRGVDSRFRGNDGGAGGIRRGYRRWQTSRRSSCDQLRMNGGLPGGTFPVIPTCPSSRSYAIIPALPHRHSGAGRNPELRRRPSGVSVGRGVDSRFRGNDDGLAAGMTMG